MSLKRISIAFLLLLGAGGAFAQNVLTGTAFNCSSVVLDTRGVYTYTFAPTVDEIKNTVPLKDVKLAGSPVLVNGNYYFLEWTDMPYHLRYVSAEGGEVQTICAYDDYVMSNHFAYNRQDGKVYCIENGYGGDSGDMISNLQTIDLTTGTITTIGRLIPDTDVSMNIMGLAINYDGDIYALNDDGSLFCVNADNCKCNCVCTMDYNPDDYISFDTNCLFFDNNTNQLYYRMKSYDAGNELVSIDIATGQTTHICSLGDQYIFGGMDIHYDAAPADAPAHVIGLKAKAGEEGLLKTTISWTAPTTTYSGADLNEITKFVIMRNDEVIGEASACAPGETQTWTDETVPASGLYKYTVKAVNAEGDGDRAVTRLWVGEGIPVKVDKLSLTTDGLAAVLSWDAPQSGEDGAYINPQNITYNVVRYPDETVVASGIKETTFTDNTISQLGRYSYGITAIAAAGKSEETLSTSMVIGPALELPVNFELAASSDMDLWTVVDADGNGHSWKWSKGYGDNLSGAHVSYWYDKVIADDWMITPPMAMQKGKTYNMTFKAQSSANTIDSLMVTIGDKAEISAHQALAAFNVEGSDIVELSVNIPVQTDDVAKYIGFRCVTPTLKSGLTVGDIKIEEDKTTGVADVRDNNSMQIVGKTLYTGCSGARVTVVNAMGQTVASGITANGMFSMENLPVGMYIVNIEYDATCITKKIYVSKN